MRIFRNLTVGVSVYRWLFGARPGGSRFSKGRTTVLKYWNDPKTKKARDAAVKRYSKKRAR